MVREITGMPGHTGCSRVSLNLLAWDEMAGSYLRILRKGYDMIWLIFKRITGWCVSVDMYGRK